VVIVGAGIGGLALGIGLIEDGIDDFVILERSDGIGGTWRHNTYPGAACDVPSHLYSFSFAPNPFWTKTYANQPEILEYLERCADDGGVRPHLRTGWKVATAEWSENDRHWTIRSDDGRTVRGEVVVFATGMFAEPRPPAIDGVESFEGALIHSARWDHSIGLDGKRIGVIGTGASGVQIIPEVAEVASHTTVFQRTPPWVLPRPDKPYSDEDHRRFSTDPEALAAVRDELYRAFEGTEAFRLGNPITEVIATLADEHRAAAISDEDLRAKVMPDYALGCNRTLVSTDYYRALERDDVDLVTDPIVRITPEGVETADGRLHHLDVLVTATGFKVGEYLHGIDVVGRDGEHLHRRWADHPYAFLGMAVNDFPNLFVFYGPNTNQGGNSIILILEAQAGYVRGALDTMKRDGMAAIDVRPEVLAEYDRQIQEAMLDTVWSTGCNSYFVDDDGRVVTQLPHTSAWYARRTAEFVVDDYEVVPRS